MVTNYQTNTGQKKPDYDFSAAEMSSIAKLCGASNFSETTLKQFHRRAPFIFQMITQLRKDRFYFLLYFVPFVNLINALYTHYVISKKTAPITFQPELDVSDQMLAIKLRELIHQQLIMEQARLMPENMNEKLLLTLNELTCTDIICPLAQLKEILLENDAAECLRFVLTVWNHFEYAK